MLSAKQIKEDLEELIYYLEKYLDKERVDKLENLLKDLKNRVLMSPASAKKHYHSCHAGGWLHHTLNVIKNSILLAETWIAAGSEEAVDLQELVMAAFAHDLGKLGDESEPYYIENPSKWHRDRGMLYEFNPKINYMKVPDRALYLLQHYNITLTKNEVLGIRLADGLYDESNKAYLMSWSEGGTLKTNLPIILHHADHMSARIELEQEHNPISSEVEGIKKIFK